MTFDICGFRPGKETDLIGVEVGEGVEGGLVLVLVMEHVMPVGKGAALDVLARETDVDA